jgi:solute carrier family 25 phosphate transporter 23/24/25/41
MASIVTYTYLKGLTYTPADNELDPMEPVYRGSVAALAGCMGQVCTYPIDVVRARLTVRAAGAGASSSGAGVGPGVLSTAKDILKESGARGLYRGLVPTLMAVGPFLACQMTTADVLKSVAFERGVEVSTPLMLCIAGSAGIAAQTVVYPLDVLRRRMQINSAPSTATASASETVLADKTWTALQQVVKREGFRSLFSGIVPTYAKVLPSVAIAMTTTKTLIGVSKDWDN